jgi:hypothetical protein
MLELYIVASFLLVKLFEHRICASRKGKWLCWHRFQDVPGSWGEERECRKCHHRYVTSLAEY